MYEQRLKNIDGDFLTAVSQVGECIAACTRVSNKLLPSHRDNVKGHDDDALPKWRMTHWKWYNAALLLPSE
jgi:hypothetical protein